VIGRKDDPAFLYFPTNYRWSMGLLICLGAAPWMGIEIDEVHRVGRALEDRVGDDHAWFEEWTRMGERIEARGRQARERGHKGTAASCFLRASRYYQTGERFIHPRSQRSMEVYARSVQIFKDAASLIRHPRIESVEVPYAGTSLPALLVHPDAAVAGARPAPCMVFFDGFDVTKELQYGYGIPDLAARGVGCLIVDGPGNGESVRYRNLPLIAETERYASAAYEYLAGRSEFDASAAITRRAPPRSSRALPAAWPGARNGIITRSGPSAWMSWPRARCCRSRCRRNICSGCSAFPAMRPRSRSSKASASTASCRRCAVHSCCCTAPATSRYL